MKMIKHCGTIVLCSICLIGMLIVLMTTGFYGLKCLDWEGNSVSSWFTQNASVNLELLFPSGMAKKYNDADNFVKQYEQKVNNIESIIENFCTTSFPNNSNITKVVNNYKLYVMKNEINNIPYGDETPEHIESAIKYVNDFKNYLQKKGIDFLYVSEPEQEKYWYSDLFKERLKAENIDFLNLSEKEEMLSILKFDASGHWMPVNALAVTSLIAEQLNAKFEYEFDVCAFNKENYYNVLDLHLEKLKEIKDMFGYEYYFPVPIDSDEYVVIENEESTYTGDFTSALLSEQTNWNRLVNENVAIAYHDMLVIKNGGLYDIINKSTKYNSDKKVLILGDSFS